MIDHNQQPTAATLWTSLGSSPLGRTLDAVDTLLFVIDPRLQIVYANRYSLDTVGLSPSALQARPSAERLIDTSAEPLADALEVLLRPRSSLYAEHASEQAEDTPIRLEGRLWTAAGEAQGVRWSFVGLEHDGLPLVIVTGQPHPPTWKNNTSTERSLSNRSEDDTLNSDKNGDDVRNNLENDRSRYRYLFERAPVAMWEGDLTPLEGWFAELRKRGVRDLHDYFGRVPDARRELFKQVRRCSVNPALLELFGVDDLDDLEALWAERLLNVRRHAMIDLVVALWRGRHHAHVDLRTSQRNGRPLDVRVELHVPKDAAGRRDFSHTVINFTDVGVQRRFSLERALLRRSSDERARIGQMLHDSLRQQLTGIAMLAGSLQRRLRADHSAEADAVAEFQQVVQDANRQVRQLIHSLVPPPVARDGLTAALRQSARDVERWYDVSCNVRLDEVTLPDETALHLFSIAHEAMLNAAQHARAKEIVVVLDAAPDSINLDVRDNGIGLDLQSVLAYGSGLDSLHCRAELIGAQLTLTQAPSGGTVVRCRVPVDALGLAPA